MALHDYDYGPPVVAQGATGTPADTTGVLVSIAGGSPYTPPEDAGLISVPGGSPTWESQYTPPPPEPEPEPEP